MGRAAGTKANRPEAGKNYGWPVITYGVDYSGAKIGEGTAKAGMEQPLYYWDPVIAPSGMVFYTGEAFPGLEGQPPHRLAATGALGAPAARGRASRPRGAPSRRPGGAHPHVRQGPDGLMIS